MEFQGNQFLKRGDTIMEYERILILFVALLFIWILTVPLIKSSEKWIEFEGEKLWKIPDSAFEVETDPSKLRRAAELKKEGKLLVFSGEALGTGNTYDYERAKISAYAQFSEFLNNRVSSFAQLVEDNLTSAEISSKNKVTDSAVSVYKRVTEIMSSSSFSGLYPIASWKVKEGNVVKTNVLVMYDHEEAIRLLELDNELKTKVSEMRDFGLDFFNLFNQSLFGNYSDDDSLSFGRDLSLVNTSRSQNMIFGIGEGTSETKQEAYDIAKGSALKNLVEQLSVRVESQSVLQEIYSSAISGNSVAELSKTKYEKLVKASSDIELRDVKYEVLDEKKIGNMYYFKIRATTDVDKYYRYLRNKFTLSVVKELINDKLFYTAKKALGSCDFSNPTSEIDIELAKLSNKVENVIREVESIANEIKTKSVSNTSDAIWVSNKLSEMYFLANDIPDRVLDLTWVSKRILPFLNNLKVQLLSPRNVWMGETLDLEFVVVLPPNTPTHIKFLIFQNNEKGKSDLLTFENGRATLRMKITLFKTSVSITIPGVYSNEFILTAYDVPDSQLYDSEKISSRTIFVLSKMNKASNRLTDLERYTTETLLTWLEEKFGSALQSELVKVLKCNVFTATSQELKKIFGNGTIYDGIDLDIRKNKLARYVLWLNIVDYSIDTQIKGIYNVKILIRPEIWDAMKQDKKVYDEIRIEGSTNDLAKMLSDKVLYEQINKFLITLSRELEF
jgi:hypothetical protein